MRLPAVILPALLALAPASADARCTDPPLGETALYLRGSLNAWLALDEYRFQWSCDAYYLNVALAGGHEFKIADAGWSRATTFGAPVTTTGRLAADAPFATSSDLSATGNLRYRFGGEHTLRFAVVDGAGSVRVGPRSFADPRIAEVDDPIALGLRFDSRDARHKTPFGAVVPGTPIDIAMRAPQGVDAVTWVIESRRLEGNQDRLEYRERARVPLARSAGDASGERWVGRHAFDGIGVYGYWFEVRIGDAVYAFQNNRDPVFWTRERGSGGVGRVEALRTAAGGAVEPDALARIRRFRQTVYAADFIVPAYAPDLVYYYVFPERFRDGDPSNNPVPGERRFHDGTVELHADWNAAPFVPGSGDGSDHRHGNDFFGGDLAGVLASLDGLQELGISALYMTPVFDAASNHKYDTADYHRVDPAFGSNDELAALMREAAKRGIRVILDASLNHVGADSRYFNRWGHRPGIGAFHEGTIRPDSPYASWFSFDPSRPGTPYTVWSGAPDLPEIDEASADFRTFAFGDGGVMQRWLDAGATGWRMDVAPWVSDAFWRDWRRAVKAHRPDALTVAEAWFDASGYLLGDTFDSTMNYIFRNAVLEFAAGADARATVRNLELLREHYPPQAHSALMNLLSSHDTARSLHVLGEGEGEGALALAKRRLLLAAFVQMTYPGSPAIYYGDEVGLSGGDDPMNRRTYPWPDRGGTPDLALRAQFKALLALRSAERVLRRGSLDAPLHVDEHTIVWWRRDGDALALVAANGADVAREIEVSLPSGAPGTGWRGAWNAEAGWTTVEAAGATPPRVRLRLPALSGAVWRAEAAPIR